MNIVTLFYFLFSIFEIFSSNYSFNFKQVESIPSDIVCYDYSKFGQKDQINHEIYLSLEGHFTGLQNFHYSFDLKNQTGVCLKKFDKKELYQILFAYKNYISDGIQQLSKKPIALGVNKNIIAYLTLNGHFYIAEIPPSIDPNTEETVYYHRKLLKGERINFDKGINDLIKKKLCVFVNSRIYCFAGNEGEFYFTYDAIDKKEAYLLTIEKKDSAKLKSSSITNKNDNLIADGGNKKASDTNETFFKKYLRFKFFLGLCLSFVIIWGIAKFLIVK